MRRGINNCAFLREPLPEGRRAEGTLRKLMQAKASNYRGARRAGSSGRLSPRHQAADVGRGRRRARGGRGWGGRAVRWSDGTEPRRPRPAPLRPDPLRRRRLWRRRRDCSGGREADRFPPSQTRPAPHHPAAGYDDGGAAVAEE